MDCDLCTRRTSGPVQQSLREMPQFTREAGPARRCQPLCGAGPAEGGGSAFQGHRRPLSDPGVSQRAGAKGATGSSASHCGAGLARRSGGGSGCIAGTAVTLRCAFQKSCPSVLPPQGQAAGSARGLGPLDSAARGSARRGRLGNSPEHVRQILMPTSYTL